MRVIDRVKAAYAAATGTAPQGAQNTPPTGEVGWDDTVLYQVSRDFARYNPDSLIARKGYDVYRKVMLDDQVKAVMRFKQGAVTSRDWYFDIESDDNGDPREDHQEMADFFGAAIDNLYGTWTDHLTNILSALINGFSINEKIFGTMEWNGRTMWTVADMKLRPYHSFCDGFVADVHGNVQRLLQRLGGQDIEMPLVKIIHFVHQPDIDRHYGESDLRACYRPWWSKDIIIKFQNIFLERFASGFMWAKVTGQLDAAQTSRLKALMSNISARTSAIVPGTVDLNHEAPATTDAFERGVAQNDKAIAKALLVPNLLGISEQGNTGSYSQSETQLKAFFWTLNQITGRLQEALNEQLFGQLAQWNFGTTDYPRFTFNRMSVDEAVAIVRVWKELVQGGAAEKTDTDEAWVRNLIGAPEKAVDDDPDPVPNDLPMDVIPDNTDWIAAQPEEQQDAIQREFAEKPWLRRVDFARLETGLDETDDRFLTQLADIMGQWRASLESQVAKIIGQRSMGNVAPKEIEAIAIPKKLVTAYRRIVRDNLQRVLDEQYAAAKDEVPTKMHAARIRPGMDRTQAERFLASKAMKIAGVMQQDVLKAVQQVLENGIRYDKTLSQTMQAIAEETTLAQVLPEIDAEGKPLTRPIRLENIVRTNVADAMNQARQALFNDPALKGFVRAFEYSAVMDSRTSPICEHLHGKIMRDFGPYTPPNHYMCRSILVPVTAIDDWDGVESKPPTLKPNKGFF